MIIITLNLIINHNPVHKEILECQVNNIKSIAMLKVKPFNIKIKKY